MDETIIDGIEKLLEDSKNLKDSARFKTSRLRKLNSLKTKLTAYYEIQSELLVTLKKMRMELDHEIEFVRKNGVR